MTTTANRVPANPAPTAPEAAEPSQAQAIRSALLPLVLDVGIPLGGYYLLQHLGVGTVLSLALSGLLPALRTVYSVLRERRAEPLALFTLGATAIGIPLTFLTGSARFLLAKEAIGTGPLGVWLIVSALLGKPVMAGAFRAFLARTPRSAAAWDHLTAHSPEFRRCLKAATLVWGVGFLVEFAARLLMVFTLPVNTAVWATNLAMIGTIVLCIFIAGFWLGWARELIKRQAG